MLNLQFDPIDTLFFRDGTPFAADSSPQDGVTSMFPPSPATVAGALRAALARCNGWRDSARWPAGLNKVLGDGPDELGALSIEGPFLLRNGEPLFQVPRHLLGVVSENGWVPRALLRPGRPVSCDLGDAVRLPDLAGTINEPEKLKEGIGQWLKLAGMMAVLRGELPLAADVVPSTRLWSEEPRIGLKRCRSTRTAATGQLYSTRHIRLARGVSLGVRLRGVPPTWELPLDRPIPLGGESRAAVCREWDGDSALEPLRTRFNASQRVSIIALTAIASLPEGIRLGLHLSDGPGLVRVVSACTGRPQRIGGWDSLARRPLALRSSVAPGSVFFCEVDEPHGFSHTGPERGHLSGVGSRQAWGFGLVALGTWHDDEERGTT